MFKVLNLFINASVLFFNQNLNFVQQNKVLPKVIKNGCNIQYKILGEKCGEICVCSLASPYTIRFGRVKPGSCLEIGYKKYKYSEEAWIGPFGKTFIDVYTKW